MNPMMTRFQYHGNQSDLLRHPTNMKCITGSEEDRRDCDEDWFDRLKDDLNDRKECCAYVEYRDCIKDAFEVIQKSILGLRSRTNFSLITPY